MTAFLVASWHVTYGLYIYARDLKRASQLNNTSLHASASDTHSMGPGFDAS